MPTQEYSIWQKQGQSYGMCVGVSIRYTIHKLRLECCIVGRLPVKGETAEDNPSITLFVGRHKFTKFSPPEPEGDSKRAFYEGASISYKLTVVVVLVYGLPGHATTSKACVPCIYRGMYSSIVV